MKPCPICPFVHLRPRFWTSGQSGHPWEAAALLSRPICLVHLSNFITARRTLGQVGQSPAPAICPKRCTPIRNVRNGERKSRRNRRRVVLRCSDRQGPLCGHEAAVPVALCDSKPQPLRSRPRGALALGVGGRVSFKHRRGFRFPAFSPPPERGLWVQIEAKHLPAILSGGNGQVAGRRRFSSPPF